MKKNIEEVVVGDCFEGDESMNINIDKVIDFLAVRKNEGAEEIDVKINGCYGRLNIGAFKFAEESDEDFQKRVDSEIERKQNYEKIIADAELKEYERLKIKYDGR